MIYPHLAYLHVLIISLITFPCESGWAGCIVFFRDRWLVSINCIVHPFSSFICWQTDCWMSDRCSHYVSSQSLLSIAFVTGPPNGPVLFCSLASVVCRRRRRLSVSLTLPAGGPAGRRVRRRSGGRHFTAGQYGYVPLGRHLVLYNYELVSRLLTLSFGYVIRPLTTSCISNIMTFLCNLCETSCEVIYWLIDWLIDW